MNDKDLISKISQLPENLQETVSDFVDFLIYKHTEKRFPKKPLKFGMMKGTFIMSDDFDDALDLIDARIIEERKLEDFIPFDDFVKQLKDEGKIDD